MKKLMRIFLILILLITLFGCDSWHYSDEYIVYNALGKNYTIINLTDLGRRQNYIIVPAYVNGHKVEIDGVGFHNNNIGNVTKIFVSREINTWDYNAMHVDGVKSFILSNYIGQENNDYRLLYVSSWLYNNLKYAENGKTAGENMLDYSYAVYFYLCVNIANVSYHYNYENSPNEGYYWIDDYDYGDKINIIPPNPTREGYTFAGWYKEPECKNEWLFNNDTLPEASYDEDGKLIFNETELYAKWLNY